MIAYRAQLVEAGALFAYGTSLADQLSSSARFVDKVLRGAHPSQLPVEQATTFELVINMSTARRLGIAVPKSILLRASRVIE